MTRFIHTEYKTTYRPYRPRDGVPLRKLNSCAVCRESFALSGCLYRNDLVCVEVYDGLPGDYCKHSYPPLRICAG
jgi:hypothetical protein